MKKEIKNSIIHSIRFFLTLPFIIVGTILMQIGGKIGGEKIEYKITKT